MLTKIVMLNIFMETMMMIPFPAYSYKYKVQKNSVSLKYNNVNVFTITFNEFNVPFLNKCTVFIYSTKVVTDPKLVNGSACYFYEFIITLYYY